MPCIPLFFHHLACWAAGDHYPAHRGATAAGTGGGGSGGASGIIFIIIMISSSSRGSKQLNASNCFIFLNYSTQFAAALLAFFPSNLKSLYVRLPLYVRLSVLHQGVTIHPSCLFTNAANAMCPWLTVSLVLPAARALAPPWKPQCSS